MQQVQNIQLPQLRPDLEFVKAPDADGTPVTTIYDPIAGTYEQADWRQMEIIRRLPLFSSLYELAADIHQSTTLRFSVEDMALFIEGLVMKGLTRSTMTKNVGALNAEKAQRDISLMKKLIHSYLYFRVPLIKPDRFLEATLPLVTFFASRVAFTIYLIAFVIGCYGVLIRFDEYINTFQRFFSFDGILVYSIVIICLKLVHEFAHSYTAKAFGVRVPTMGAAFIVMWPVAYSDVTDAWRLPTRRQRFLISAAGVISELCIGAVSLFLWQFSAPGIWQSIFFVLSSVTILSTLLMNLNPAMRFDGYYMLTDILRIDNLQSRAFEYTKWWYRKLLFGFRTECPDRVCSDMKRTIMIGYSLMVWVYRFFLYLGIAVMVYYKFTKILGVFLFAVEIYMFIVLPIIREVSFLKSHSDQFSQSKRWLVTTTVIALLAFFLLAPFSYTARIPALAAATERQLIYAPYAGQVDDTQLLAGVQVKAGDTLIALRSSDLEYEYKSMKAAVNRVKHSLDAAAANRESRQALREVSEELKRLSARKDQIEEMLNQRVIKAAISGTVVFVEDGISPGISVQKRELLAELNGTERYVIAYLPQGYSEDLEKGQEVVFLSDAFDAELEGLVENISPIAEDSLEFDQLASVYGGPIAVTSQRGRYQMVDTYYKVEVKLTDSAALRSGQPGTLSFNTKPKSRLWNSLKRAYIAFLQELNI